MAKKMGEQVWQTAAKIAKLKQISRIKSCERCERNAIELFMCEKCGSKVCEKCLAAYNQFSQIDYDCCRTCANYLPENDF